MIYALSSRMQVNDFSDIIATKALVDDLESDFAAARSAGCALCILSRHATDEEGAIFPAASKFQAKLVAELIEEHHGLTRRELAIAKSGHELLGMERADDRAAAGVRLNQAANELFGAYIVHMNREESELVPRMKADFTDGEMAAMRGKILAGTPPDRMIVILGWMLPSLNATELTSFLGGLRQGAPAPFLKAVTDLCAAKVDPARWAAVKSHVGL